MLFGSQPKFVANVLRSEKAFQFKIMRTSVKNSARLAGLALLLCPFARAHEPVEVQEVKFTSPHADLAGTLVVPEATNKIPCVVIVGGTLSQTRDGGMVERGAPPRNALKRLADALAAGGYASLRFDRVGYGDSKAKAGWNGSYHHEAEAAAAAIRFVRNQKEIGPVLFAGESAGAYMACLAAKDGTQADGYIFLGGLCSPAVEMYEYNFGRLVKYAERSAENLAWVKEYAWRDLALGRHYREMFDAAAAGKDQFELVDGDFKTAMGLPRRREELQFPPDEMFRHIRAPVLALAGAKDLNVPPQHAARIVQIVNAAGNSNAVSFLISGADHNFQQAAPEDDLAFRERYTFESFKRGYVSGVYQTMLAWLKKVAPSSVASAAPPAEVSYFPTQQRAIAAPEVDAKTDTTPERIQLAPGIEIIADVADRTKTAGVETLEGRIGPLLLGEKSQAHFIDMPAGMFLAEHPHSTESIIYTVRGNWVLCSQGRRQWMKPGSVYRFGANISTGYEVPFAEDACILIFKGERSTKVEKEFIDYLKGMAARLQREHEAGTPFLLKELPADHPARKFARKVNPQFRP